MKKRLGFACMIGVLVSVMASCGGGESNNSSPSGATAAKVTTLAGTPGMYGSTDEIGSNAKFSDVSGITTGGTNLYVADTSNRTIRKISKSTGTVTTLAGTAGVSGANDGVGVAALFSNPKGITTDGTNLYVADSGSSTIRKIAIGTGQVTTFAGTAGASGSADGTGPSARFGAPEGITTDGTNLYVADTWNGTIRRIDISTAAVTTLAGSPMVFGSADGIGSAAKFKYLTAITTDGTNLYVVDRGNNIIRKVVISTGAVTTIAGNAALSSSGRWHRGRSIIQSPWGIATDGGSLYVADSGNNTIRKITISTGAVTTLAGKAGINGAADGYGMFAGFSSPTGITLDGSTLYVTDSASGTIRRIELR